MPLPLAPVLPLLIRIGAVSTLGLATRRWLKARSFPGRTDQRVEEAFDELGEGLSHHRPADRIVDGESQTNTAARVVRVIRIGGRRIELDAAFMARLRIRKG